MIARLSLPIGLIASAMLAALAAGCGPAEESVDDRLAKLDRLAPVTGVVKVGGKALPGVVVTFVPREWAPAHAETDDEGRFTLETAARPGAIPGEYKVVLSYLVAADGRVLGLGPRGGFVPDPAVATATEKLPASVSSLERSTLAATVPPEGTTVDFDVDARVEVSEPGPRTDAPAEGAKE
ncbi:hypothetical protein [Paludisphaera mucosa]|uniref:Carboxypeptidase regulatory-like domain-containing protein n=1 Tax=Paludisphaera mucosa TaxID=3030827 RepID=A0ABT6FCM2_9BACT|nr:hypothetical protein [Paludisphaera mucosa]MDG3005340.1 hypothetical protein [Paludisphaera mucosa]